MVKIEYPAHEFKTKNENNKDLIFDEIRKTWLQLTPEEWVRQNFVQYLLHTKKYPSTLIALEKKIMVGEMKKRFDILVYNGSHQPWMMVECKSMDIPLKTDVLDQVLRYNMSVPVRYLVITNGSYCMAFEKKGAVLVDLGELPEFE
ncbi:MAG: type I restriction enzyme HsdR N-terminal domain-containing protein [Flavitalea sp.]